MTSAVQRIGGEVESAVDPKEALRLRLGRWLAVALGLEVGADILRTSEPINMPLN